MSSAFPDLPLAILRGASDPARPAAGIAYTGHGLVARIDPHVDVDAQTPLAGLCDDVLQAVAQALLGDLILRALA